MGRNTHKIHMRDGKSFLVMLSKENLSTIGQCITDKTAFTVTNAIGSEILVNPAHVLAIASV
jgi:hypothetical protein